MLIQGLKRKLEDLLSSQNDTKKENKSFNGELKITYQKKEMYWKQRSRILWLTMGDKNSHFFHTSTRGIRTINKLATIDDDEDKNHQEENQILKSY